LQFGAPPEAVVVEAMEPADGAAVVVEVIFVVAEAAHMVFLAILPLASWQLPLASRVKDAEAAAGAGHFVYLPFASLQAAASAAPDMLTAKAIVAIRVIERRIAVPLSKDRTLPPSDDRNKRQRQEGVVRANALVGKR
jgi:hypothetical protein